MKEVSIADLEQLPELASVLDVSLVDKTEPKLRSSNFKETHL
jgi:hypothetical protein